MGRVIPDVQGFRKPMSCDHNCFSDLVTDKADGIMCFYGEWPTNKRPYAEENSKN